MVTDPLTLHKLATSAAGSVRAEGAGPTPEAQMVVAAMLEGTKTADEALRELVNRYRVKAIR